MKQFAIISCGQHETDNFLACKHTLDSQGMPYTHLVDVKGAMTLSRGKINPAGGFVIVTPDEHVVTDIFELVNWIYSSGRQRI